MNFVSEEIMQYCETYSKPPSNVLKELERETFLKVLSPQMLAGHLPGQLLKFISTMVRPKTVLEIGTFTGYSVICLAEGLPPDGIIHTIEIDEELEPMIKKYIDKSGFAEKIVVHIGNAREIIDTLDMEFDLVFLDADKENYPVYYDIVFDKIKKGGYIIIDNALWSGKVLDSKKDKETSGIHKLNETVKNDKRTDNLLLPVRDGIMIVRKVV